MKQGTVSVLVGCHSPMHSLLVYLAWVRLYHRLPNFMETVCILIHDIGHWGKDYLDNYEEKKHHAELGAKVAGWLFGEKGRQLVAGHCSYNGEPRSKLYEPDKYSQLIAPVWWLTVNAFVESKLRRPGYSRRESAIMYQVAMRENYKTGWQKQGHDIYLEQWLGESNQKGGPD